MLMLLHSCKHFSKTIIILLLLKQPLIHYYSYALSSIIVEMAVVVLAVAVLLHLVLFSITALTYTCLSIVEWDEKAGLILLG